MTTKMIALIGEQPIPNLLPIRHVKPAEVLPKLRHYGPINAFI
jgi:hypothetical protein